MTTAIHQGIRTAGGERVFPLKLKRALLRVMLLCMLLCFVGLILSVKAATAVSFDMRPIAFFYSLFVTSFVFSRIAASALWREHPAIRAWEEGRTRPYTPSVTIVIPCKNEEASIRKTVEQSFAAAHPKELLEVIVVNDGSTDRTIEVLRELEKEFPSLTVVDWTKNRGKRHAMAEGFRRARGEIVVQLDSDSYIVPETFPALLQPFRDPLVGAVSAHAEPTNEGKNWISRMQAAYYFVSFRIFKAAESTFMTVLCASGCSSAYRKIAVLPVLDRWLNEMFWGKPVTWGDDRSLTSWVLKSGYATMYTFRARAYTIVPETFRQLLKQQIRWKKSWIINTLFTARFIWRRRPFAALTHFFPLAVITVATPVVAAMTLYWTPFATGRLPFFYIVGILLIATLVVLVTRIMHPGENRYGLYLLPWALLTAFFLSTLIFYSLATIQNRGWGTR